MGSPKPRTLAWVGPDPLRIDAAHAVLDADRLAARGTSAVADYTLDWVLTTDAGWVTRRLSVRARGDGWSRSLELVHDDGDWSVQRREGDQPAEALDATGLEDALDCDLGLCPFTNTMPVLRHDLVQAARRGEERSVDLVMAWVAVPELTVHVSDQRYAAHGPAPDGGGALIHFSSDDFAAMIDFDEDGLVRDYPELARRIAVE